MANPKPISISDVNLLKKAQLVRLYGSLLDAREALRALKKLSVVIDTGVGGVFDMADGIESLIGVVAVEMGERGLTVEE